MNIEPRCQEIFRRMHKLGRTNAVCTKDPFQSRKYLNNSKKIKSNYNQKTLAQEYYSLWADIL